MKILIGRPKVKKAKGVESDSANVVIMANMTNEEAMALSALLGAISKEDTPLLLADAERADAMLEQLSYAQLPGDAVACDAALMAFHEGLLQVAHGITDARSYGMHYDTDLERVALSGLTRIIKRGAK